MGPPTTVLNTGHLHEGGFLQSNKPGAIILATSQLMPISYSSSKSQLKKHGVNCPPEQHFASCMQGKILHTDSRLLAQFSPWKKKSCSVHSSGCFICSDSTQKLSHMYHINSLLPGSSPGFSRLMLQEPENETTTHKYNTTHIQVKQKSTYLYEMMFSHGYLKFSSNAEVYNTKPVHTDYPSKMETGPLQNEVSE